MTQQQHSDLSAYEGPSGRTRMERVRVFRQGREPVEVGVYRVVNVEQDPELREAALGGTLHALDDGEVIDVPFIYHDPVARRFILVIPHAARGREVSERAKVLEALLNERESDVPDYVRSFVVVYGRQGLLEYLDELETMEVRVAELEPLDEPPCVASPYSPLANLLPPAEFWTHAHEELALFIDDEELWVFGYVRGDEHDAFQRASSELLIQLEMAYELPICVLTLSDRETHCVRRAYLNPEGSADRRALELLKRDFHAAVVVYSDHATLLRSFRLEAPRAANTAMILDRCKLAPPALPGRFEEAVDACRRAPPPTAQADHPFVLEDVAFNAAEALRRLQRLEAWTRPEKTEEALWVISVPKTVFELSRRLLVSDGVRFGLAMSGELLTQAVRFGFAPGPQHLLAVLEQNFEQTLSVTSAHGLSESEVLANREALTRLRQMYGTSTAPELSCNMSH
ncbi:MAG: hypothetical protein HKN97_01205 [Myxococcales bacterium]|nr:hypothetical protein [Myxococcales bacterium]